MSTKTNELAVIDPAPAEAPMSHFNNFMAMGLQAFQQVVPESSKPAPLRHVQTIVNLSNQWAARNANNSAISAGLLPHAMDADTWKELLAMQAAVLQRLQDQQKSWVAGVTSLAQDYAQIKQAKTMSKYAEQQFNLIAQFGQLVSAQATALMGLQENIQVDYGYWAAQKQQGAGQV
ncbi:hypothetical protein [Polaromonas naphthalenivorans]|uniref:Phasin domain-containing protein n=1 Tax=Polaromonas naphthalenivorans (strain CJ2) TaxID=365044 RepID=A1VX02_POLNA|nr:hypothetical protein [Polaromonas naphthalenivorans]ABM40180.1 hypothetical protein Pnap_4771 [Polaromonas naphthalenivorans CJ2]